MSTVAELDCSCEEDEDSIFFCFLFGGSSAFCGRSKPLSGCFRLFGLGASVRTRGTYGVRAMSERRDGQRASNAASKKTTEQKK